MTLPLHVAGLVKRYDGVVAVDGVGFAVGSGEVVGLLGANGAGKSTTIGCIVGLLRPDAGTIRVGEVDAVAAPREAARRLGVHLQATDLPDAITVREAMALFHVLNGRRGTGDALLDEVGLLPQHQTRFAALSHGQRQRLALALALINDPAVLVLDEPTASLDPHSRRAVHDLIRRRAAGGCAVLVATHLLDDAQRLCDRVLLIDRGRVLLTGTPAALIEASGLPTTLRIRTRDGAPAGPWQRSEEGGVPWWTLRTQDPTRVLAEAMPAIARAGDALLDLSLSPPGLDDVFLAALGRPIDRDGPVPGGSRP